MIPSTGSRRRFWLAYSGAWLPYMGVFVLVFLITETYSLAESLRVAVIDVAPQALLGIAVLALTRAWPWPTTWRLGFVVGHTALAVCYGVLSTTTSTLLFSVHRYVVEGVFAPYMFDASILL